VLRHARETENGNLPDLTNKLVDAIAKILSEVGSPLEHYRVQRASRILLNAQSVERVLPIITNEILSLPKVKTLLDRERETAKKAAEEEIKSALREKISELQSMEEQAAALRNELGNLQNRIREAEKEYEIRTGSLESGFKAKLRELMDNPGELAAELAVLRSALHVPPTKASDYL